MVGSHIVRVALRRAETGSPGAGGRGVPSGTGATTRLAGRPVNAKPPVLGRGGQSRREGTVRPVCTGLCSQWVGSQTAGGRPEATKRPLLARFAPFPGHVCTAFGLGAAAFGAVTLPSFTAGARRLPSPTSRCWTSPASWRCTASGFTRLPTGRGPRSAWRFPTRASSCSR